METNEPRALTAALSAPAFVTRGGGLAMHSASRHVERWAPEANSHRSRPLRNLSFVDRLLSPWVESAQRSQSLRMYSQYITSGVAERASAPVSWVFPRPWYQDELDWMAAARVQAEQQRVQQAAVASMLTTRGTYVAPAQQQSQPMSLPTALYEYVAPSLSVARPEQAQSSYSPLVPYAASEAAHVMSRATAPLEMTQSLRGVLATMLERAAAPARAATPTRASLAAPELVTPPAPRSIDVSQAAQAAQAAERYAEQYAQVAELQRIARAAQERETAPVTRAPAPSAAPVDTGRDVRAAAVAQREAEIQQRLGEVATARREAERQRVEERIAERIAERTREHQQQHQAREQERTREARQLHESAREAAARDARIAAAAPMPQTVAPVADLAAVRESQVAAAIQAAMTALPPELASVVTASVGQRPERAVQAINEIGEALRTVELIARTSASGGAIEPTRGPRLMMPAGLGGLVATVERTRAPREMMAPPPRPMVAPSAMMPSAMAPGAMMAPSARVAPSARTMLRLPTMAHEQVMSATMPATLAAAAQSTPAALQHVAWSDRWLARFAGARPQSLEALAMASATPEARLQLLAQAAPQTVFVAPFFDGSDASGQRVPVVSTPDAPFAAGSMSPAAPMPTLRGMPQPQTPVLRFDDDAETPDDVLAAISMAASRSRPTPVAAAAAAAMTTTMAPAAPYQPRDTLADQIAHSTPMAPGAGLSAQLASSPFAAALHHLVPFGAAPTFDVRALFGEGIGATYLAGLLAASTEELAIAPQLPAWAGFEPAAWAGEAAAPSERAIDWEPTYVAPEAPAAAAEASELIPATQAAASNEATVEAIRAVEASRAVEAIRAYEVPLRTLRTALLAWDVESVASAPGAPIETRVSPATMTWGPAMTAAMTSGAALASGAMAEHPYTHTLLESLSLPLLGQSGGGETAYTAPGQMAERAHQWSIAQQRSVSDLTFDFVTPELVLAARVYGLGPAEAAQAMRLAIAGPGHLSAMANTVDRTFVQAMAIEAERRGRTGGGSTAYPLTLEELAAAPASSTGAAPSSAAPSGAGETPSAAGTAFSPSRTSFGVERRAPRGAFLWPAATTAALGMQAQGPDGDHAISVAALELLAAQAVAELGTFTALGGGEMFGGDAAFGGAAFGGPAGDAAFGVDGESSTGAAAPRRRAGALPLDARDDEVFESAAGYVPVARREKFQALYVALGQSATGRSMSPAARAARAIALAGRGGEVISARERAAIAWDVLPVLHNLDSSSSSSASSDDELEPTDSIGGAGATTTNARGQLARTRPDMTPLSTGAAAERASRRRDELNELFVDSRPGLARLSARAGEALGLYVAPSGGASEHAPSPQASSSPARELGAVLRAPTAAPELVQTGAPAASSYQRYGGGEVEIPSWFEAAAKKMFENQSPSVAENISLAELTLVSTARPSQIAASSRGVGTAATSATPATQTDTSTSTKPHDAMKIDVERLAGEVYSEILSMMDAVRARNGESH